MWNRRLLAATLVTATLLAGCRPPEQATPPKVGSLTVKPSYVASGGDEGDLSLFLLCRNDTESEAHIAVREDGRELVAFGGAEAPLRPGQETYMGLGDLRARRTRPIRLVVRWRHGAESGEDRWLVPANNSAPRREEGWRRLEPKT